MARPRIAVLVVLLVAAALGAGYAWVRQKSAALLTRLEAHARARGAALSWTELDHRALGSVVRGGRLSLPSGSTLRAPEIHIARASLSAATLRVPQAHLVLQGAPTAAFQDLRAIAPLGGEALRIDELTVEYLDRVFGTVLLSGLEPAPELGEEYVRVRELQIARVRWQNVTLRVSVSGSVLKFGLGRAESGAARAELRYISSQGQAAEWVLDVPNQALPTLLDSLGVQSSLPEAARLTAVATAIVPDDPAQTPRANWQLVVDRWPRPAWPDAAALTGSSGSIAVRAVRDATGGSWSLPRAEVGAGLFALNGSGTLQLDGVPRLRIEVKGTRSCSELALNLPPSVHREQIRAHEGAQGRDDPKDKAELGLVIQWQGGPDANLRFDWRLAPGCGLPGY